MYLSVPPVRVAPQVLKRPQVVKYAPIYRIVLCKGFRALTAIGSRGDTWLLNNKSGDGFIQPFRQPRESPEILACSAATAGPVDK